MARPYRWPKTYTHFVVVHGLRDTSCLDSGWEYREDAVDRQKELQKDLTHHRYPGYKVKVASSRSALDLTSGKTCVGWPPHRTGE